jgi:hypothetical protein
MPAVGVVDNVQYAAHRRFLEVFCDRIGLSGKYMVKASNRSLTGPVLLVLLGDPVDMNPSIIQLVCTEGWRICLVGRLQLFGVQADPQYERSLSTKAVPDAQCHQSNRR